MSNIGITKNDLRDMCDDIGATFPDRDKSAAVDAMTKFIMERLGKMEWMERSQLTIALKNVEKWFEQQEPEEKEHFQKVSDYVVNKLRMALKSPVGSERI